MADLKYCDCCDKDVKPVRTFCKCGWGRFYSNPKTGRAHLYCHKCNTKLPNVWIDEKNNYQHGDFE